MRKVILLLMVLTFMSNYSFGQLTYSSKKATIQMIPGMYTDCKIKLSNNGDHEVMISWRMISSTLKDFGNPDGAWNLGYCACTQCFFNEFAPLVTSENCPDPFPVGYSLDWYLKIDPAAVAMNDAEWVIEITNHTDNILDTLTYRVLDHPNSVNDITYNASVTSYPNPVNTELVVNYDLSHVSQPILKVYSIIGQEMVQYPLNQLNGYIRIPTTQFENGMYFFTIEEKGQNVFQQKFNVMH